MNYVDGSVSAAQFIGSATSAQTRITKIDQVINGLLNSALVAIETGHINKYTLDDKQTVISCEYRNAGQIMKDIEAYRSLKAQFQRDIIGTAFTLVNGKGLRRYY
jgi:hypothetical protein